MIERMEQYEINSSTLAILSMDEKNSKVIEKDHEYLVPKSCFKIVDESCQFFGSSYIGREKGSRRLIGSDYKVPIVVEETKRMIFIPTSSPKFSNCDWISYQHIDKYESKEKQTVVTFKNGKTVSLPISIYSLENQILRAIKLENTLRNHIQFSEMN